MNITLYTYEVLVRYILYCALFGLVAYMGYCVISAIISFPSICECTNITSLNCCIGKLISDTNNMALLDFLSILIVSVCALIVSFIANSGEFRIMSIPLLLIGFASGKLLFNKIVFYVMSYLFFLTKKVALILFFPILMLKSVFYRVIKYIVASTEKRYREACIIKYTKTRYKELEKIKHTGMLEEFV